MTHIHHLHDKSYILFFADSSFVCCPERTTDGVDISTLRRAFGNSEDAVSQVTSVPVDTENNINAK